jgi:hypothetical protein
MEKPFQLIPGKSMRDIRPFFLPRNFRRRNEGKPAFTKIPYKAYDNINTRSAGIVHFAFTLPAPGIDHFLCQFLVLRIIRCAETVKQDKKGFIRGTVPPVGCLAVMYE